MRNLSGSLEGTLKSRYTDKEMNPIRKSPQDFLDLLERSKRGRLKVYLGFAAGVGKTYKMLQEAHDLAKRGVDIVLGYIEPHSRAETATLIDGLEVVPRLKIDYMGMEVEDMDLDAVLARDPEIAVVDEVAHSNAPTCRNQKRYQDILELLEAGINVICAFNIQHLESLNDLVKKSTGVAVRETVPDTFLKDADQVVTLDLAAEDLIERLRAGKIYPKEKIQRALENFFREDNLATLRELSLREVAENLERTSRKRATENGHAAKPRTAGGRVMVCIASASPKARVLLRRGSRMAGRLNTHWFVVYVETPRETPLRIDAKTQRILLDNIEKARELGAEVVRLQATDPVHAILDFAKSHGVGHVILGRSRQPWWKMLFGKSILYRIIEEAEGLDVHIVSFEAGE
jgi:two-component system sensor histidine kinase KdpD